MDAGLYRNGLFDLLTVALYQVCVGDKHHGYVECQTVRFCYNN